MRTENLLNRTVGGYRLLEILGRGGMSIVYLAQRLDNLQDQAAIKILIPSEFATGPELSLFQARFLREVRAVHQVQHEHILPVLDYGEEDDNLFYMVMPYISGGTLAHVLTSASEPLPFPTIDSYLDQLASAIDYSNQQGMVHRDIKPSNVLVDEQGKLYLVDFGIVRVFDSTHLALDEAPKTLTTTGKIFGTPAYMAPERFRGEPAEPATDLYSLGILLYQLVTGQVPFEADNALALGLKHLNEPPLPPRALRPDLPKPAEAAILKAISKRPSERFTNASTLSAAFAAGLKGEWAEGLPTTAAALAVNPAAAQVKQALADSAAPIPAGDRLAFGPMPAGNNFALAFTPTDANLPIGARRESHFWRNAQVFTLVLLILTVLVSAGLLALAVYKIGFPLAPPPGINVPATSTSGSPTKTGATPTPSSGTTPAGSSPTAGKTPTRGITPTPIPTPTTGVTPTPIPTPTTGVTPTSIPTVVSTP
ncbi:MAG TPA: serine/threonine-protein kinase [Ktedonobacteraceae bacterium]